VIVSDVKMPGMDGLALLDAVRRVDPDLPVILITGHGDVPMAVEAMHRGAWDFVEKPFEPERLSDILRRAADHRRLVLENRRLRAAIAEGTAIESRLIGRSRAMERLREAVLDCAASTASVLITGETGSGKELIAQSLHAFSPRRRGPFVAVNCAAIPETLIEAELFGHEAGAFTGAARAREGHFEAASGGTIFLDEITSLPVRLQPTLLRVLQEREVTRIGSRQPVALDVRVIAATNEDVETAVAEGRLRRDLLFRINTLTVTAPPLRARGDDVVLLFEHFAERFAAREGVAMPALTAQDRAALMAHDWPGNVRELVNLAERAVLRARRGPVSVPALLAPSAAPPETAPGPSLRDQMDAFERQVLEASLRRHRGAITEVMAELDLPRRTLNEKMARHDLNRRDYV
jgi:two-component system C4-dicarboxylate transport response regulator DctD